MGRSNAETRKLAERLARIARRSGLTEFDAHHLVRETFRDLCQEEMRRWELQLIGVPGKRVSATTGSAPELRPNGHAHATRRGKGVKRMAEDSKRPSKEFRAGSVRASIWVDERTREDGSTYEVGSAVIERRYKDGDEWKSTNRYGARDLANLWLVIVECLRFLALRDRDPSSEQKDGG